MTEAGKKAPEQTWVSALQEINNQLAARRRTEEGRRAKLTPDQRAAEDARWAAQAAAAAKAKLSAKVTKAAVPYGDHASFTLLEWACLLRAKNPEEFSEWFADFSGENDKVLQLVKVLHASVRLTTAHSDTVPLTPVNPTDPSKEWRFPQAELMRVALAKKLGYASELAAIFGLPPAIGVAAPPRVMPGSGHARIVSKAARARPQTVRPAVAKTRQSWQVSADALIAKLDESIPRRAADTGRTGDETRAEFLKTASMKAVHAEWGLRFSVGGKPERSLKHFAAYVNKAHPWVRFEGGSRGKDGSDRKAVVQLLEGENGPETLPT